jgi:hypothetical protein
MCCIAARKSADFDSCNYRSGKRQSDGSVGVAMQFERSTPGTAHYPAGIRSGYSRLPAAPVRPRSVRQASGA